MDNLTFESLDRELNNAHGLFLTELNANQDNELRISFSPGKEADGTVNHKVVEVYEKLLESCVAIVPDEDCLYEIMFDDYIIYQIRNESFSSYDPDEIKHGHNLIKFEKSKLLDYLRVSTDAQQLGSGEYYPGKWEHYGIYTQNHIIDVISLCHPKVRILT